MTEIIAGSDITLQVTVRERTNTQTPVLDISTASEITWTLYERRDDSGTAIISKTKTADSDITFVTNGEDGRFSFAVTDTETSSLKGSHWCRAVITISGLKYKTRWQEVEVRT